jgi:hypothetical protein
MKLSTPACFALGMLAATATISAEKKLHVLPVVVSGISGAQGSYWDTEVRVLARSPNALRIRRVWVAGRNGGQVDDPQAAPSCELPLYDTTNGNPHRMLVLPASFLSPEIRIPLDGHLAYGLEVEGDADVFLRNADTKGQPRLPADPSYTCCLPGSGQLIKAATEYLHGESIIPWVTAGTEAFRTNIGLINPSDKALRVHVRLVAMASVGTGPMATAASMQWFDTPRMGYSPTLVVELPPWGWRQLNDVFRSLSLCDEHNVCTPSAMTRPSHVRILPEGDGPYLAYASVVYSPTNDPEFIWAEPGGMKPPLPDLPK